MLKEGFIFLLWGIALFIVFSPFVSGIEYPSTAIFTFVLLLGIWKSRWSASIHSVVFLLLAIGFFLRLPSDGFCYILWGGSGWFPDGGYYLGQFFCRMIAGISFIVICYNSVFLVTRKVLVPKDFAYWLMWGVSLAFFGYSFFVAETSFVTFFLYALPCALVERRRSIIYFSNIWTLCALVGAPIILWKTSGQIHDSFYLERTNEIFFGALGDTLHENLWLRSLFLLPWILMIWAHTKNTILNKNIFHGRKLQK